MLNKLTTYRKQTEQGFTLIELLVVIIIIGVLAAIAIPIFMNQQKTAIEAGMKQDLKSIALAQQTYIAQHPSSIGTVDPAVLTKLVPNLSSETSHFNIWIEEGIGYCIVTSNKETGVFGGDWAEGRYFWYDSAKGGMAHGELTGNPPIGGACDITPRPTNARWVGSEGKWVTTNP